MIKLYEIYEIYENKGNINAYCYASGKNMEIIRYRQLQNNSQHINYKLLECLRNNAPFDCLEGEKVSIIDLEHERKYSKLLIASEHCVTDEICAWHSSAINAFPYHFLKKCTTINDIRKYKTNIFTRNLTMGEMLLQILISVINDQTCYICDDLSFIAIENLGTFEEMNDDNN